VSRSIVGRLIIKDLYLGRWLIGGTLLAGAISLATMPLSSVGYYVGSVSLLCVLIVLNIFVNFQFVLSERKDKTQLFVLSLPVSTTQYTAAKVISSSVAFGIPWLLLVLGCAAVIDASAIPNGMIPTSVAVLAYVLAYFCVFLAVGLLTESTGWTTTTIIVGNISVNFLIPWLLGQPSVIATRDGTVAVWSSEVLVVIAAELAVGALALVLAIWMSARNRNFVA
jgi:ABC-type transport system involved in multi-copper enzyme maturation permease subunit